MGGKVRCYVCKEQIDETAGHHVTGIGWRCEEGCTPRRFQAALDASQAECERLRTVIRTGGAMYRAERAAMGIPGGVDQLVWETMSAELGELRRENSDLRMSVANLAHVLRQIEAVLRQDR